jgi:hypothetical protein
VSGSATPKNIRPMPMPALNIIATHEIGRNSGSSSSQPSGMLPNLPSASPSTKTTNPDAVSANNQPDRHREDRVRLRLPVRGRRRRGLRVF